MILCIDTATAQAGIVLIGKGSTLGYLKLETNHASDQILEKIDELIQKAGIKLSELEGVFVIKGPGSFTGLRAGIAFTQGFCFARRLPIFTFNSFLPLVPDLEENGPCCAAIPAKRDCFYIASNLPGAPGVMQETMVSSLDLAGYSKIFETLIIPRAFGGKSMLEKGFSQLIFTGKIYNFKKVYSESLTHPPERQYIVKPNYIQSPAAAIKKKKYQSN